MPTVRCVKCGFVAVRNRGSRGLDEVDSSMRETWEIPACVGNVSANLYEERPICFVMACNLGAEVPKYSPAKVLEVLNKDRECGGFINWRQGSTPKEHQEMLNQQALLEWQNEVREKDLDRLVKQRAEDQERLERQRREDLEWKASERRDDREWKTSQEKAASRQFWIVGVIATLILAAAQIIGSLIQAGLLLKQ